MKLKSKNEKVFLSVVIFLLVALSLSIIFPLMNILAISFSDKGEIVAGNVGLLPKGLTLSSYKYVMWDNTFISSFKVSVFVTVVGTLLSLATVTLAAYPLSKPHLRGRKSILLFFVFTMMFSGGLVPSYIIIKSLGLINTVWALILPSVMSVYNMLLVKNFMEGLPESLEESAKIDGANDFQIFLKIVLPLCKPVLATVGLFFAVGYWNSYFPGIMYINDPALKPLQTHLYELIQSSTLIFEMSPAMQEKLAGVSSNGIQAATIVAATVPILIVYPFLQKHFVKGIVVGSEK